MLKSRNIADQPETLNCVLKIVKEAGKPVSIEYVSYNTKLSWHTVKSILFRLCADGKLQALDTTKSWVFMLKEEASLYV